MSAATARPSDPATVSAARAGLVAVAATGAHLRVPPELELHSRQVTNFRHVRYPRSRPTNMTPETDMPGTPPLEGLNVASPDASSQPTADTTSQSAGTPPLLMRLPSCAEDRPRRLMAAAIVQRCVRCYLARRAKSRLTSAVGRPAQVRVTTVTNLEMLCDFRDVISVYCNIRVLKKPYGPFMFQFSSSRCSHVNLPTWEDDFFVPMISSRCELVVTLIGVSTSGRLRFLGQAIAPLETGWEKGTAEISAPLGKWAFPIDESLTGLHRFVKGRVHCTVTALATRHTCLSGQFQMAPFSSLRSSSFFGWTRRNSSPMTLSSPMAAQPETPTASRKEMVTRWGVLTDTHMHLFAHSTAKLIVSMELSKLQLVRSSPMAKNAKARREPGRLHPLKIYCNGTLYTLYVSTYAQQLAWEYHIDLHRRQLLIP